MAKAKGTQLLALTDFSFKNYEMLSRSIVPVSKSATNHAGTAAPLTVVWVIS